MSSVEFDIVVFIVGGLFLLALAATIGRIADPQFQCTMRRRFEKKNYIVVNFGDKKGRTIFQYVVNADDGVIIIGSRLWVLKGGRIYNTTLKQNGKIIYDEKKGYTLKDDDIKYTPGAPNVFLNPDTLTPLEFAGPEAEVKPDEIGSTLMAWVSTQINKNMNKLTSLDLWVKVGVILCVALLLGEYFILQEFDAAKKRNDATNAAIDKVNMKVSRLAAALHISVEEGQPTTPQTPQEQIANGTLIVNGQPGG